MACCFPRLSAFFRDVARDGTSSYEIQDRGSGPIRIYMLYIARGSAAALAFLKIMKGVAGRSWGRLQNYKAAPLLFCLVIKSDQAGQLRSQRIIIPQPWADFSLFALMTALRMSGFRLRRSSGGAP